MYVIPTALPKINSALQLLWSCRIYIQTHRLGRSTNKALILEIKKKAREEVWGGARRNRAACQTQPRHSGAPASLCASAKAALCCRQTPAPALLPSTVPEPSPVGKDTSLVCSPHCGHLSAAATSACLPAPARCFSAFAIPICRPLRVSPLGLPLCPPFPALGGCPCLMPSQAVPLAAPTPATRCPMGMEHFSTWSCCPNLPTPQSRALHPIGSTSKRNRTKLGDHGLQQPCTEPAGLSPRPTAWWAPDRAGLALLFIPLTLHCPSALHFRA